LRTATSCHVRINPIGGDPARRFRRTAEDKGALLRNLSVSNLSIGLKAADAPDRLGQVRRRLAFIGSYFVGWRILWRLSGSFSGQSAAYASTGSALGKDGRCLRAGHCSGRRARAAWMLCRRLLLG